MFIPFERFFHEKVQFRFYNRVTKMANNVNVTREYLLLVRFKEKLNVTDLI